MKEEGSVASATDALIVCTVRDLTGYLQRTGYVVNVQWVDICRFEASFGVSSLVPVPLRDLTSV